MTTLSSLLSRPSADGSRLRPRQGGFVAALVRPAREVDYQFQRLVDFAVFGLGGTGCMALQALARLHPSREGSMMAVDTDVDVFADLPPQIDRVCLTSRGDLPGILQHREKYPFLRGVALPDCVTPREVPPHGVGQIRILASLLLGFNLDEVKMRLRRLLERRLRHFRGPTPKRLIVHLVFSLGGGTGSALALPLACLIRDAARSIAGTLAVTVQAHALTPACFASQTTTPANLERILANGAETLHELRAAQTPSNLDEFTAALGVQSLNCPLFDELSVYDISDSGHAVHPLPSILDRVVAAVSASRSQALQMRVVAREVNAHSAQFRGVSGGIPAPEQAIIAVTNCADARVPVAELAALSATQQLSEDLDELLRPASGEAVRGKQQRLLPLLRLDETRRSLVTLLQDNAVALPGSVQDLPAADALRVIARGTKDWDGRGKADLHSRSRAAAKDMPRTVTANAKEFLAALAEQAPNVAEKVAILRWALDQIEDRKAAALQELQALAAADARTPLDRQLDELRNGRRPFLRADRRAPAALDRLRQLREAETRQEARRVEVEAILQPVQAALGEDLSREEEKVQALETARRQFELQFAVAQERFGTENEYSCCVIAPPEVPGVLDRMAAGLRQDHLRQRRLAELLRAGSAEELRGLLERHALAQEQQAVRYLHERTRDLAGLIEHFGLAFDLHGWLRDNLAVTLPAQLNLSPVGPGNAPVQTYVVAAETMQGGCEEVVRADGNPQGFQFRAGEPFEIFCVGKIARSLFDSIPGLTDMERAREQFLEAARAAVQAGQKLHVWMYLPSHGTLERRAQTA